MARAESSVVIERPVNEVFEFVTDPRPPTSQEGPWRGNSFLINQAPAANLVHLGDVPKCARYHHLLCSE